MVQKPKPLLKKRKPTIRSPTLMTDISVAEDMPGTSLLRMMAMPLTPPVLKLLGNLKKYTPMESSSTPALMIRNRLAFFRTTCGSAARL